MKPLIWLGLSLSLITGQLLEQTQSQHLPPPSVLQTFFRRSRPKSESQDSTDQPEIYTSWDYDQDLINNSQHKEVIQKIIQDQKERKLFFDSATYRYRLEEIETKVYYVKVYQIHRETDRLIDEWTIDLKPMICSFYYKKKKFKF